MPRYGESNPSTGGPITEEMLRPNPDDMLKTDIDPLQQLANYRHAQIVLQFIEVMQRMQKTYSMVQGWLFIIWVTLVVILIRAW